MKKQRSRRTKQRSSMKKQRSATDKAEITVEPADLGRDEDGFPDEDEENRPRTPAVAQPPVSSNSASMTPPSFFLSPPGGTPSAPGPPLPSCGGIGPPLPPGPPGPAAAPYI